MTSALCVTVLYVVISAAIVKVVTIIEHKCLNYQPVSAVLTDHIIGASFTFEVTTSNNADQNALTKHSNITNVKKL